MKEMCAWAIKVMRFRLLKGQWSRDLGHRLGNLAVDLGDKDWVESLVRFGLMAIGFGR